MSRRHVEDLVAQVHEVAAGVSGRLLRDRRVSSGDLYFDLLARRALATHPSLILDLGCGTGDLAAAVEDLADSPPTVVGLDASLPELRLAHEHVPDRHPLVAGDMAALPIRSGRVDVATSSLAMFLSARPVDALREALNTLRPGGRLLLVVPGEPIGLYQTITELVTERAARQQPGFLDAPVAAPELSSVSALRSLIDQHRLDTNLLGVEEFDVIFEGEPSQLAGDILDFFYLSYTFGERARHETRRAIETRLRSTPATSVSFPHLLISLERRAEDLERLGHR